MARESDGRKKVFIVEDHPVFSVGLARLLNNDPGLVVCGTTINIQGARDGLKTLRPDLLVVDLMLPDGSGFDLIEEAAARFPKMAVLVLSMADETIYARRALRAGARGYMMKSEAPQLLLGAVHQVLAGETCVSVRLRSEILTTIALAGSLAEPAELLTPRERDVLKLIGEGKTTSEIARALRISSKTVDSYRGFLKRKLGARDNGQLVCRAVQLQLMEKQRNGAAHKISPEPRR